MDEEQIKDSLKRCSPDTIEAAIAFQQTKEASLVPTIVIGIIERFLEPELREMVRNGDDNVRLLEDLGIDSLLMVEVIILVEEILDITVNNEDLTNLATMGDIKSYLKLKIQD